MAGTYKIALNQRACTRLISRGIEVVSRAMLYYDDQITPIAGLELVELDKKFVRELDAKRRPGRTYSDCILRLK